ncbi:serine hydrolase domain-containing protein [Lapidilactobacillus luobeiensis]|uniref:serine hydrolase domain-containing protein n=1 Tax=Lapidilactobacillus luobeiensis TaxID=2950371 RepID=UPI0021C4A0C3|nr:serine hydrolase domain-containing protein [Lapidilactobacillus luobeiensis]
MYPQTSKRLNELVSAKIVPGISYALIDHQHVSVEVRGQRRWLPTPEPLTPGLLYDLASLTKVVGTATVIFQLVEQGDLKLTDPVQRFLPEFTDGRVQVQHLLTHTSGIHGFIPYRDQLDGVALKRALLSLPVTATFERRVVYTDVGFLYLGWIIEAITGVAVQTVISQRVLAPLQLFSSTFTPSAIDCVPTTYTQGSLRQGVVHDPKARQLGEHCGSAGLFAPLSDLITFSQWYLGQRPDLPNVISSQWRQSLCQDWTRQHLRRSLAWDLRQDQRDGHRLLFHTGFTGTFLLLDLARQQALIVLSNRVHPIQKNDRFLQQREVIVQSFIQELPRT